MIMAREAGRAAAARTGLALAVLPLLQVGPGVVDGKDDHVALGGAAGKGLEPRGAVIEQNVFKNEQLAGTQLVVVESGSSGGPPVNGS